MAEPTAGPWTIAPPSMGFTAIYGPRGELIFGLAAGGADERQPADVCEANARLIAAAPDLYAALLRLIEVYSEDAAASGVRTRRTAARDHARAALSKAIGESGT